MRIKVSDGDLIVVVAAGMRDYRANELRDKINEWLTERGLQSCKLNIICTNNIEETTQLNFTVLSVNDIFQEAVLDDKPRSEN